jgi:DNA-binding MarR family transcriptional regulator
MANGHRLIYPVDLSGCARELELISTKLGVSKANAIREAVRTYARQVKGMKVIELRSVSGKQAEKEILGYLKEHGTTYTSEIADNLRLDVVQVHGVLTRLAEKGVVK